MCVIFRVQSLQVVIERAIVVWDGIEAWFVQRWAKRNHGLRHLWNRYGQFFNRVLRITNNIFLKSFFYKFKLVNTQIKYMSQWSNLLMVIVLSIKNKIDYYFSVYLLLFTSQLIKYCTTVPTVPATQGWYQLQER